MAAGPQEFKAGDKSGKMVMFCPDQIKETFGGNWGPVKKAEMFASAVYKTMQSATLGFDFACFASLPDEMLNNNFNDFTK